MLSRMTQKFGAQKHTGKKLDVLDHWHGFYPLALRYSRLRLIYIDAFAGTGEVLVADDDQTNLLLPDMESRRTVLAGSASRALGAAIPYDEYVFIEKSPSKLKKLEAKLTTKFPERVSRCRFVRGDANNIIKKICAETNWDRTRAVVFLDPFGNQIEWATLEAIAQTRAADVWYLFPSGLGFWRQIPKDGVVDEAAAASVTRMVGDNSWQFLFTKRTTTQDLFGRDEVSVHRDASVAEVTEYAIGRLRTIFRGAVLDEYVRLGGTRKVPWYALLFASANPGSKAKELALRVARHIVRHAD